MPQVTPTTNLLVTDDMDLAVQDLLAADATEGDRSASSNSGSGEDALSSSLSSNATSTGSSSSVEHKDHPDSPGDAPGAVQHKTKSKAKTNAKRRAGRKRSRPSHRLTVDGGSDQEFDFDWEGYEDEDKDAKEMGMDIEMEHALLQDPATALSVLRDINMNNNNAQSTTGTHPSPQVGRASPSAQAVTTMRQARSRSLSLPPYTYANSLSHSSQLSNTVEPAAQPQSRVSVSVASSLAPPSLPQSQFDTDFAPLVRTQRHPGQPRNWIIIESTWAASATATRRHKLWMKRPDSDEKREFLSRYENAYWVSPDYDRFAKNGRVFNYIPTDLVLPNWFMPSGDVFERTIARARARASRRAPAPTSSSNPTPSPLASPRSIMMIRCFASQGCNIEEWEERMRAEAQVKAQHGPSFWMWSPYWNLRHGPSHNSIDRIFDP